VSGIEGAATGEVPNVASRFAYPHCVRCDALFADRGVSKSYGQFGQAMKSAYCGSPVDNLTFIVMLNFEAERLDVTNSASLSYPQLSGII
jgi:hypothetical protein